MLLKSFFLQCAEAANFSVLFDNDRYSAHVEVYCQSMECRGLVAKLKIALHGVQ